MADRRESEHPGIYKNAFSWAKRVLSATGVPEELILGQAEVFAKKAVSRRLAVEKSFHKSAADIVDAGKAIIEEKGWSSVAGKGNLAEQLGGKLQDSKERDLSGHTRSLTFLGRLSSVADFLPEDSLPELDENTPKGMFELFINFGHKLGVFIPDSEEEKAAIVRFEKIFQQSIENPNLVRKLRQQSIMVIEQRHPTRPFSMTFRWEQKNEAEIDFRFMPNRARQMTGQKPTS